MDCRWRPCQQPLTAAVWTAWIQCQHLQTFLTLTYTAFRSVNVLAYSLVSPSQASCLCGCHGNGFECGWVTWLIWLLSVLIVSVSPMPWCSWRSKQSTVCWSCPEVNSPVKIKGMPHLCPVGFVCHNISAGHLKLLQHGANFSVLLLGLNLVVVIGAS